MITKTNHIKYYLLLLALLAGYASDVFAERPEKVVRVGWYDSPYNHINNQGQRQGYAYEYQCRIAANVNWTYEYVEGEWLKLFKMLERGEIDVLSGVTMTDERKKNLLFSEQEMGMEDYYIIALNTNKEIGAGDISTLKGKRIGVQKGTIQETTLTQWVAKHNIEAEIVKYDHLVKEHKELLNSGDCDAICAQTSLYSTTTDFCKTVTIIGSSNYYFAISKQRPDLKEDIDKAMAQIRNTSYNYNSELYEKYFAESTTFKGITNEEEAWIRKHGNIIIAYRDNYMPYCGTDEKTGKVKGLLKDFIDHMNNEFANQGVHISAVAYPTINDAIEAVKNNKACLAFPSGLGLYESEKENLLTTPPLVKSSELAVMRSNDNFRNESGIRAAINASNPNYLSLLRNNYPSWKVVNFNSTLECLKGVANGEADLLLISTYRLGVLNHDINELGLKVVATGAEVPLAFTTKKEYTELFTVFSRMTGLMPASEIQAALTTYSEEHQVTFMHFFHENPGLVMAFSLVLVLIFAFLLLRSHREHRRAERANKAKTQFLFNMSHDIRTPMNAVIGYTDLIEKNLGNKEKCNEYVGKIRTSSNFLLKLINNILEMARIDSGKTELDEEATLAKVISNEITDIFTAVMTEKNITFISTADTHTKAIYCDQVKIREVLMNLVSNAFKYTPEGGTVTMDIKELPSTRKGYTKLQTRISDTGIGMSEDFLPTIFERFTREKNSTEAKIQGTGLGLSIVKKLVDLMQGTIEVESKVGEGTTFIITMEHRIANEEALQKKVVTETDDTDLSGKRLLIVEDNDLNAEIINAILEDMGILVERAQDGVECVKMMSEAEPGYYDAILMDVQMPNMNGYEATDRIRRLDDERKAFLPIIAMTANAFEEDKDAAIRAGMNGHLSKPVEIDKLTAMLKKWI